MSLFMLHQKRISRARCLVFTIPRCDSCNFTNISRCRVFGTISDTLSRAFLSDNNDELIDDEFDVSLVETQLPISSAKLAEFKDSSVERFLVDRDQWLMVRFNNYSTSVNIVVKFLTTVKNS
jgi:hypothetical protein